MAHSPLVLPRVLLSVIAILAASTDCLAAQGSVTGPQPSLVWNTASTDLHSMTVALPDTVRHYPPTYWQEGLIAGAVGGALFGALLGSGLCAYSDVEQSCTGATLGGALLLGATGGTLGALIGGLFPKRSDQAARTS